MNAGGAGAILDERGAAAWAGYNRSMTQSAMAKPATTGAETLDQLNERITACARCPRLRAYCAEVAARRKRMWADWQYWGRPVPSFGDPAASVLALGLAPGAHGSNRTGRPFTGDGSGDFLYPVLYETGFASAPAATSREDGLMLRDLWISSVSRCAPPDNKPTTEELANCAPWLDEELRLLGRLRVVVCLGKVGFDGLLRHQMRTGHKIRLAEFPFAHGVEYKLPGGLIALASYHPSLQNTNTGKLTRAMFLAVFERARQLAGLGG